MERIDGQNLFVQLQQETAIVIYGQAEYGKRLCCYLKELGYGVMLSDCLFVSLAQEQSDYMSLQLQLFDVRLKKLSRTTFVVAAFSLKYHAMVLAQLQRLAFDKVLLYTPQLENVLRNAYFRSFFQKQGKTYEIIYEREAQQIVDSEMFAIYMVCSAVDKNLLSSLPQSAYIKPIQAGAVLTEARVASLTDAMGNDHISNRNRQYSEWTAIYWLWKHAKEDYIGICHYRRHFVAVEEIAIRLVASDLDVVLPTPTFCLGQVCEEYYPRYIPQVWPVMLEVLKSYDKAAYVEAMKIFSYSYYYACNMAILKREVLADLCDWMFPMLEEIEKRVGFLADSYYNRYVGFCAELLSSLYFISNSRHYKIAHAEKIFLG